MSPEATSKSLCAPNGLGSINELLRIQFKRIPNVPVVSYPSEGATVYEHFTPSDLDRFANSTAKKYSKFLANNSKYTLSNTGQRVVALLGPSNLDYLVSILAISRLDMTVLFLSTRISDAAYVHLFEKTGCTDVAVHPSFAKTMARVKDIYGDNLNVFNITPRSEYALGENSSLNGDESAPLKIDPKVQGKKAAWIIHSSGSTGLPKPVSQTNEGIMMGLSIMAKYEMEGFITMPLFHAYGVISLFAGIHSGRKVTMYNADLPLTASNMIATWNATKPQVFYSVPYALKLLSEAEGGIEMLKEAKLVTFAGSSCPEEVGNILVKAGVKLVSFYGSTEAGGMLSSAARSPDDLDWNYLQINAGFAEFALWEPVSDNIFELVVRAGWPAKVYTNRPDGGYSTNDLFIRHPTDPSKWKYIGRRDDTIVLSNGEKANPIPMELSVKENPYVSEVVVFGAERTHLGMLVVKSERANGLKDEEVLEKIWSSVEHANENAYQYAKVSKEMISFLDVDTQYPRTDKGTAIRAAFYRQFKDEIDALYEAFDYQDANSGLQLSEEETVAFVKSAMIEALRLEDPSTLKEDTDFFSLGLDSLGAMQVHSKITKQLNTGGKQVGQNIVFEKPSVKALASYLYNLRVGGSVAKKSDVEVMEALIKKYSHFQKFVPGTVQPDGDYIIVTGATGSLGAHLVSQLVKRENVRKVYCLNRASSMENAKARTEKSLKLRKVYETLTSEELAKIKSYPSDFSSATLGVAPEVYEEFLNKVTKVIHGAWQVNFNMDVTSFEQQHIKGSCNLMNLCLNIRHATPASFSFCSSISTCLGTPGPVIKEKIPDSLTYAMPMGYGHSKLVTEHLCAAAAAQTGMISRILRIGQVAGDSIHGHWNASEAIPLTVQAALTFGALPRPTNDEILSWLPVDDVAATIIDLSYLPAEAAPLDAVFHVSHPKEISWNNVFLPGLKKAGLKFEEVDQREWIRRLAASNQDPAVNPPVKLLEFFKGRYDMDSLPKSPYIDTTEASKYSKALREVKTPDEKLVAKFLKYWQSLW